MSIDPADSQLEVSPAEAVERVERDAAVQLIDVREDHERAAGHIADTRHIRLVELPQQAQTIAREHPVVFYCRSGSRSLLAAQAFREAGFEAYSMNGGLVRWVDEGLPLVPDGGRVVNQ